MTNQSAKWIRLLKKHLIKTPSTTLYYVSRENIAITIYTNKRKKTSFGGYYSAFVHFYNGNISITFLSPKRKPDKIKTSTITGIEFYYSNP